MRTARTAPILYIRNIKKTIRILKEQCNNSNILNSMDILKAIEYFSINLFKEAEEEFSLVFNRLVEIKSEQEEENDPSRELDNILASLKRIISDLRNIMKLQEVNMITTKLEEKLRIDEERSITEAKKGYENRISELTKEIIELKNAQSEKKQERIEGVAPDYVTKVTEALSTDAKNFWINVIVFNVMGAIALISAISLSYYFFDNGLKIISEAHENIIYIFLYIAIKGVVSIGLLSWLSYIFFSISRKYSHEVIRRKDRIHAVMFGNLFLTIYGDNSTKEDILEAFKNWNISEESAFSTSDKCPPNLISTLEAMKDYFKISKSQAK